MKGLLKFSTAALALAALASCSNDEFLSESNGVKVGKNALHVTVEGMVDPLTTRVAFTPNAADSKGTLYWQEGDEIRVLDGDLRKYDPYQFSADAASFLLADPTGTKYADPVKYALFGTTSKEGWDRETNSVTAEFTITKNWAWAEDEVSAGEGELAFVSNLPMAGTAEEKDGEVSVSLEYTTGIFRIDMENVPGNVTKFILKGYKSRNDKTEPAQLTGQFTAKLATDGVFNEKNVVLEPTAKGTINNNSIEINFKEGKNYIAKREKTSLFIPVIAGYYGRLEFYYVTEGDIETELEEDATDPYKVINNFTVERGKFYKATVDTQLKTAGNTPSAITTALGLLESGEEDLTLEVQQHTTVSTTDATITIPEALSETNLTLDLKKFRGTNQTLYINSEKEYTGKLTVSLSQGSEISNIRVDLPAAEVAFVGELGKTSIGVARTNAGKYTLGALNVKTLTIGDGTTSTTVGGVYVNAECSEAFYSENPENEEPAVVVMEKATVSELLVEDYTYIQNVAVYGTVTNELNTQVKVVNDKGRVDDQLNLNVATGKKTVVGIMNVRCNVSLEGDAHANTVNIDLGSYDVSLDDKAYIGTLDGEGVNDLTIEGTEANVTNATVKGDVTVDITGEKEVVKASLTMKAGKTLNLKSGYIKAVSVTESSATNKLTIAYGEDAKYTAIGSVTDGTFKTTGNSVWNGELIGNNFNSYNNENVHSANQLASWAKDGISIETNLYANVDLGKNTWTPYELNANFHGNNNSIIGGVVEVTNDAANGTAYAGLFTKIQKGTKVEKLTIENINVSAATSGNNETAAAGALAGYAEGDVNLYAVTVDGGNVKSAIKTVSGNSLYYNSFAGGVIGRVIGQATVGEGEKEGEKRVGATVKNVTIEAPYHLGGLFGEAKGAEIKRSSVEDNIAFTVTGAKPEPGKEDKKSLTEAGAVGMFIGKTGGTVTLDKANSADIITGNRATLGFKQNFITTGNTGSEVYYYYYNSAAIEVGMFAQTTINSSVAGVLVIGEGTSQVTYTKVKNDVTSAADDSDHALRAATAAKAAKVDKYCGVYVQSAGYGLTDAK